MAADAAATGVWSATGPRLYTPLLFTSGRHRHRLFPPRITSTAVAVAIYTSLFPSCYNIIFT